MSTRNLVNLVLLAIIAVLIVVVVYEPGKEKPVTTRISSIDKSTITRITIKRTGVRDVVLVKQDKRWYMQSPYQLHTNEFKTEGLLELPDIETTASYDLEKLDPKTYGLDKPRASITYNDQYTFDFGTTEPLKNQRYIRFNNRLYLTADVFYHRMSVNETDYLDHSILPEDKPITKMVLPGFSLALQDGTWQIDPKPDSWSNDQANELAENWKLSQAIQISPYTEQKHAQQVKIYLENEEQPLLFDVIKKDDQFFLARPDIGLQYEMSNDKSKELLELPPKVDVNLPDPGETTSPAQPD